MRPISTHTDIWPPAIISHTSSEQCQHQSYSLCAEFLPLALRFLYGNTFRSCLLHVPDRDCPLELPTSSILRCNHALESPNAAFSPSDFQCFLGTTSLDCFLPALFTTSVGQGPPDKTDAFNYIWSTGPMSCRIKFKNRVFRQYWYLFDLQALGLMLSHYALNLSSNYRPINIHFVLPETTT